MLGQRLPSEVASGHRLLANHRWEIFEEIVEAITRFEVVEKRLDRHPGSGEDGSAAQQVDHGLDTLKTRLTRAISCRRRRHAAPTVTVYRSPAR